MHDRAQARRAITLAGGGPAAGLHIGVLLALDEFNRKQAAQPINFDVWALSCIGAWVGIVYNTFTERKAAQTHAFFRDQIFRDEDGYASYPVNRAFGPDSLGYMKAWRDFITNPKSYDKLVLPSHLADAAANWLWLFIDPRPVLSEADRNAWWHNNVLAVNPAVRFMMSLMYLSPINGLTKIHYEDSSFLESIRFDRLDNIAPHIYHNAWKLPIVDDRQNVVQPGSMKLFHNRPHEVDSAKYAKLNARTLCACSALPFIEQTVPIEGEEYCEGALVDTVNFKDLLEDYPKLEEVWVVRIVDVQQVRAPKNLADALANLCMLFAAETGENDVKLFKQHMHKRRHRRPRIIEIPVSPKIDFQWNDTNLQNGIAAGSAAMAQVLKSYAESSFTFVN